MRRNTLAKQSNILELAELDALYKTNCDLRVRVNAYVFHLTALFSILTYYYEIRPHRLNTYKLKYESYSDQLSLIQNEEQAKNILIKMAESIFKCLVKDLQHIPDLPRFNEMSVKELRETIPINWELCRQKYGSIFASPMLDFATACFFSGAGIIAQNYSTSIIPKKRLFVKDNKHPLDITQINQLTTTQIERLTEELKRENDKLRAETKYNHQVIYSFYALIFVPLLMYNYFEPVPVDGLNLVAMLFFVPFVIDILRQLKDSYKKSKLPNQLLEKSNTLESLIPENIKTEVIMYSGDSLKLSYFKMTFTKKENLSPQINLSPKTMTKLITNIFLSYGIPLINAQGNSITIEADVVAIKDKKIIAYIKSKINEAIKRYEQFQQLRQQVTELCQTLCLDGTPIPEMNDGLVQLSFYIKWPTHEKFEIIRQEFFKLFSANEMKIKEGYLFIRGYQAIDKEKFTTFIAETKQSLLNSSSAKPAINEQPILPSSSSQSSTSTSIGTNSFILFNSNNNAADKKNSKTKKSKYAKYNNKNKFDKNNNKDKDNHNDKITLIEGKGLPPCFYMKYTLTKEDFGQNFNSYVHFNKMAKNSQKANARRGATGFVFIDRPAVDNNGNEFRAKGMLKALGEHGEEGVLFSEEKIDGKDVFVSRMFTLNRHKYY
jgi:hypothetical protein